MSDRIKPKKIGELVEIFNNLRVPLSAKEREKIEKIYPYYGAQNIVDYVDNYLFDGEYILVAEDGENLRSNNQNICNLVNGKFWVNNHAHILCANKENNTKYLYYNFNRINFEPYITGSAQPKLNKENLLNIITHVHDIEDQQKIVSVLSSLDSKIELNNRINAELKAMAKTLYDYWFVQFDFPNAKGKPYKTSGGKMVWNEELKREIPEGWEVKMLFDGMDVQYGFPFDTSKFTNDTSQKPVIRIRDILENTISTYSTEDVQDKYKLYSKDLLIGMDGNFHLNFWDKDGAYLNQRSVRIRSRANSEVSNFQALFELTPHIKAREKNVSRTTVGHLSDKDLKRLYVINAKPTNLFKPKLTFDSFLEQIIINRLESQKLSELRDWLLPMLMNGQVKVGDAEKMVEEKLSMAAEPSVKYGKK